MDHGFDQTVSTHAPAGQAPSLNLTDLDLGGGSSPSGGGDGVSTKLELAKAYLEIGEDEGIIEEEDSKLIQSVVEFGDRVRARAVSAGGQNGDPASKHFNDQAARYATGDLREVYFYRDQVNAQVERQYKPGK